MDLVVGDSDGVITLFSRQKILSKHHAGGSITQIDIFNDHAGSYEVIAGDVNGDATSFQQYDTLWKLNVAEQSASLATLGMTGRQSPTIKCVLSVALVDRFGCNQACLLITDGWAFIHFIERGKRVQTLQAPTVVHSMCTGRFLDAESLWRFKDRSDEALLQDTPKIASQQVLLAGKDGNVYVMINSEIHRWFKVGFCLSKIMRFRPSALEKDQPDMVLCVGHSNSVKIYHKGMLIEQFRTSDWPHTATMGDVNADGQDELVLGLLDQTIEVYGIQMLDK